MLSQHHIRIRPVVVAVVLGIIFAACEKSPTGPDADPLPLSEQSLVPGRTSRRVAAVDAATIDVPRSARIGDAVAVSFSTSGGGCVGEDTTIARTDGARAVIVPYQSVYSPRANEGCTLILRINRRNASLTFTSRGTAQVVIVGRSLSTGSLMRITRAIVVQ